MNIVAMAHLINQKALRPTRSRLCECMWALYLMKQ